MRLWAININRNEAPNTNHIGQESIWLKMEIDLYYI